MMHANGKWTKAVRLLLIVTALALLYGVGVGIRRSVWEAQFSPGGGALPFTLESALLYRRIKTVYEEGLLPERDRFVQYPEGVVTRETYTVGSEYLYAGLARLLPNRHSLSERLRWIETCWFCLAVPLVALWMGCWSQSVWAALVTGLYYAVSASSVIRSTGQELTRENAAFPLLAAHLLLDAVANRTRSVYRWWAATVGSGLMLCLAVMTWDLMQYYILLWAAYTGWIAARGRLGLGTRAAMKALVYVVLLGAAGAWHPYLRAHGFLTAPPMLLVYGVALTMVAGRLLSQVNGWARAAVGLGVLAMPWAITAIAGGNMGGAYQHFFDLLWAKVRFLNWKPWDPALLNFEQRIMWVPALHSATWRLTLHLFPAILLLTLPAGVVIWARREGSASPNFNQLLFFYVASLIAFGLFARFHVFLSMFSAALLGGWATWAVRRRGRVGFVVLALLAAGVVAEAHHVLSRRERWGRRGVYYRELVELTDWLRAHGGAKPVLANFGTSSSVVVYGNQPVLLHPKFENPTIRNRVREYGQALFTGTERAFRDWADRHGAEWFVYGRGAFATVQPRRQMRYFVNALDPPHDAAARIFEWKPEEARYFNQRWKNRKYRVFDILTHGEEEQARALTEEARKALERGELDRAEAKAVAALRIDPKAAAAMNILLHVEGLRREGFSYRPGVSEPAE